MVRRKLNTCVLRVKGFSVAWLRQIGAEWLCHVCGAKKEKGVVSFEMACDSKKVYMCLRCALDMLDAVADEVRKCDDLGAEAYHLFRRL